MLNIPNISKVTPASTFLFLMIEIIGTAIISIRKSAIKNHAPNGLSILTSLIVMLFLSNTSNKIVAKRDSNARVICGSNNALHFLTKNTIAPRYRLK